MSHRQWDEVKYEVAVANRVLAETGLATGFRASLGHVSMRIPSDPDKFVVKGRGYAVDSLHSVRPEDMIVCDINGEFVDGPVGSSQCFEVKMHSSIMQARPDVSSVTHVHPHFIVLATTLRQRLRPMNQEGVALVKDELPVWEHIKTVQNDEEGKEVAGLLGSGKAVLLRGHGATTVGSSPEESVMAMLNLEEQAKMNYYALSAMGQNHPYIEDELILEMTERTAIKDLPHFAKILPPGWRPRVGGVWQYYTRKVQNDPSAAPPMNRPS